MGDGGKTTKWKGGPLRDAFWQEIYRVLKDRDGQVGGTKRDGGWGVLVKSREGVLEPH